MPGLFSWSSLARPRISFKPCATRGCLGVLPWTAPDLGPGATPPRPISGEFGPAAAATAAPVSCGPCCGLSTASSTSPFHPLSAHSRALPSPTPSSPSPPTPTSPSPPTPTSPSPPTPTSHDIRRRVSPPPTPRSPSSPSLSAPSFLALSAPPHQAECPTPPRRHLPPPTSYTAPLPPPTGEAPHDSVRALPSHLAAAPVSIGILVRPQLTPAETCFAHIGPLSSPWRTLPSSSLPHVTSGDHLYVTTMGGDCLC